MIFFGTGVDTRRRTFSLLHTKKNSTQPSSPTKKNTMNPHQWRSKAGGFDASKFISSDNTIEAVILDMDGVLAETSGSYRQAILRTAKSFGVNATMEDIENEKVKGDANNDWVCTHRLVKNGGVKTTLDEVTERFEELYQGT